MSPLDLIERVGNLLPEPVLLFLLLAVIVMVVSALGTAAGWSVQPLRPQIVTQPALDAAGAPILDAAGKPIHRAVIDPATGRPSVVVVPEGQPLAPRSLLTSDGLYWAMSNMVHNFINFAPLGLVLTSMLGIGLAEKVGLFSSFMRWLASITPRALLTPSIMFLGCNASIASDAGYIILPPLAAGLYAAMGRSPVAGIAAAFAGVAGGFGAGLFVTGADAVLAGVATPAANIIDPGVKVLATTSWYFKAASVPVLVLAGWAVTDLIVEPRLVRMGVIGAAPDLGGSAPTGPLTSRERRGLLLAGLSMLLVIALLLVAMKTPGWPLYGDGQARPTEKPGPRWSQVIVPMMFFVFLTPGIVYGLATGALRTQKDFVEGLYHAIRTVAPVIAMAFFAAQFIEYFKYSNLDRMLAYVGGDLLIRADLPIPLLLVLFIVFIVLADFAMSSMTAKFTALAPIIVPMFMLVGVSPDLTIAAYRIGDSVVNTITPLNAYLLIVLLALQRYRKDAGMGTLIALMTPYSLAFGVMWTLFLLAWFAAGVPVGPGAGLHYVPGHP